MKPLNLELLVKYGAMSYPASAFPAESGLLPPLTEKEEAILAEVDQQMTRAECKKACGYDALWAAQKTQKQIGEEHGLTYRQMYNLMHRGLSFKLHRSNSQTNVAKKTYSEKNKYVWRLPNVVDVPPVHSQKAG